MPFVVRIAEEDIAGWSLANRTSKLCHYRPRGFSDEIAEQIQLISSEPLENLINMDLVGFINIEKGWMSEKIGRHPETKIQLKIPREPIRSSGRLRIKIASVDEAKRPPRVVLEQWEEG